MTKHWQPWTIEDGALRLTRWPDHGPGVVLVEVDVFGELYGPVLNTGHGKLYSAIDGEDDVLRDLFAHIDAHPETHYVLRTLPPERVRECWPKRGDLGAANFPEHCDKHPDRRGNVILQIGPIHTQADADRLLPAGLECSDLVAGLGAYCQPTERIDFRPWLPGDDGCESCDDNYPHPPRCMSREIPRDHQCPRLREVVAHGGFDPDDESTQWIKRLTLTGITADGGDVPMHPDLVRYARNQAVHAGVEFVFASWGDWLPVGRGLQPPEWCNERRYESVTVAGSTMLRVGREHSGNMLDGRTWPRTEAG